MQEWESKKMKKDLDAAKQEIDSLRHLKEEVFTRKQERDKARYELEWSQRKIENLERERKELEKSCKALKETSSELQKRQADTWKEREKYLQGLRELEEDLRQSEAEKEYWKCKAEEHPDVVVTEKRAGDPVPTMAGIPDRRHVDFEVENVRLRRAVKEMRRKLKENENATGDLIETINELSVENAKWESAKLEKARRDAERENK